MNALEACYYRTREDEMLFEEATKGLPQRSAEEPYHCGAHNVRAFDFAINEGCIREPSGIITYPRVFEVGFNLGYSAAIMLALGADVTSIDVRNTPKMQDAAHALVAKHSEKHFIAFLGYTVRTFHFRSEWQPTLAFIDGSHEHADVLADIAYCRSLGITRYLFDDWPPHWGPGVQSAIYESGLLPLHIIGSMAYCVVPDAEEGYFKPTLNI